MFQIYVRLVGEVLVDDCILSGIYKLVMNLQILERQGNIVFERSFHRIEECHSVSAAEY